jgi:hypothetical protein
MTWLMLLLTLAYIVACFTSWAAPGVVPFAVLIWGGLILIFGWWAHDAIHERQARRVVA